MSASNWAPCPRCMHQKTEACFAEIHRVQDLYGKVPVEEFDALRAALPSAPDPDRDENRTFREDYEFYGTATGTVFVRYRGECEVCRLRLEFEHDHPFWDPADG